LAVVATGEYYELNGASMAAVQNVLTSAVLDLDVLYEKELAINFSLLNPKIYDDKTTDPFDETSTLNRVQHARVGVKLNFPNVNSYDIGHVFHKSNTLVDDGWGSGGLASTPAVCQDQDNGDGPVKAGGWSGSFVTGNSFLRVAAHEFAHMFSANHTFNGEGQSCDSAIDDDTAYEIGSGTTLMSYAGICDDDQNVPESFLRDDYFHVHSLFQMVNYVQSLGDCPTKLQIAKIQTFNTPGNSMMKTELGVDPHKDSSVVMLLDLPLHLCSEVFHRHRLRIDIFQHWQH